MNRQTNENLYRFIRSVLRRAERSASPWNTPPDSVFENAMVEIEAIRQDENKRRRRRSILLLALLVPLVLGAGMVWYMVNLDDKIDTLETRIESIHTAQNDKSDEAGQTSDPGDAGDQDQGIAQAGANDGQNIIRERTGVSNTTENKTTPYFNNNLNEAIPNASKSDVNGIKSTQSEQPGLSTTSAIRQDNMQTQAVDREQFALTSLSSTWPGTEGFATSPDFNLDDNVAGIPVVEKARSRFFVSVSGQANFSRLTMRDIPPGPPELAGYDKFYSGGGAEVMLGYRINARLSGVLGASYSHVRNQSQMTDAMLYDSALETTDPLGNPMYSTDCDLMTPMGTHLATLQFYTSGLNGNDGDMIRNSTDIEQKLSIWTTSLGVRYKLFTRDRFDLEVGGGGSFSYVSRANHVMHTSLFLEDQYVSTTDITTDWLDYQSHNFFSAYGEFVASYRLNSAWALSLTGRASHSLSSLLNTGTGEPRTYLRQFTLGLGIAYTF